MTGQDEGKDKTLPRLEQDSVKVDCSALERELGTSLGPVLDAFALGMNDKEVAEMAELPESRVKELRARLAGAGSNLGLSFKKPVCQEQKRSGSPPGQ
ncbi:MAG TPA: hypothetical protein GX511_04705 [Firmicutes bacterium]|nr:hypothetical protein [Bacillota bacterium]